MLVTKLDDHIEPNRCLTKESLLDASQVQGESPGTAIPGSALRLEQVNRQSLSLAHRFSVQLVAVLQVVAALQES